MQIAFFGLGAVGGHFAARLARAGNEVSAVARGPTLEAVRRDGLRLLTADEELHAAITVSDDGAVLGPQEVVISTVKATDPVRLAAGLAPLIGPHTQVVFAQNGIPWWYPIGLGAKAAKPPDLDFLDPGGALRALVAPAQVVGAVIYSSNEVLEPGRVRNVSPGRNWLHLGHPDDRSSNALDALRRTLDEAGISSPVIDDIRSAIWGKLALNISASVLSLLTGHKITILGEDERLAEVFRRAAAESIAIAAAHGIDPSTIDPEWLIANPPDHLPSLRQDYNLGRALELDAMVMAPLAFARASGLQTPVVDSLAALAVRMGADAGLYVPP